MTRKILAPVLILMLLAPVVALSAPGATPGRECGPGKGDGMRGERREGRQLERLAATLGLSDEQREKVRTILTAETEAAAPSLAQIEENRDRLHRAVHSGAADEQTIRELAAVQGTLKADLLVLRARSWRQIHQLLTPEQQELARNFRPGPQRGTFGAEGGRGGWDRD